MFYALPFKSHSDIQAHIRQLAQPVACLLVLCVWMLAGLTGHEPWKPDEAYSFGLVHQFLQTHDWVVPMLAGEPFLEKPPLYYLTAAAFAKMTAPLLPLPDGARLVNILFLGLALTFTGLAAKHLYKGNTLLAAVILIGAPGLLIQSHLLLTDIALLAGFAMALYGLAIASSRSIAAGIYLGCGTGIAFMSKGLLGPGVLGATTLVLPLLFPGWRNRHYVRTLAIAFFVLVPWITLWPALLYHRSPDYFWTWLWTNNFGRYFGFAHLGPHNPPGYYLRLLCWYAFPALPLALWGLWQNRHEISRANHLQLPLVLFLVQLAVLSLAADSRELYAMPMLIPLSLLAIPAVDRLPGRPVVVLDWLAKSLFSLFACLLWLAWNALVTGHPAWIASWLANELPGYAYPFSRPLLTEAAIATLLWVIALWLPAPTAATALMRWTGGLTLTWVILSCLWLAPVDWLKGYRPVALALIQHLPASSRCIASSHLGEGQRALLAYYAGIVTQRTETHPQPGCPLLLVQDLKDQATWPGPGWQQIWEGGRPADRSEHFRLYQRSTEDLAN